jgi:hypothetical protein
MNLFALFCCRRILQNVRVGLLFLSVLLSNDVPLDIRLTSWVLCNSFGLANNKQRKNSSQGQFFKAAFYSRSTVARLFRTFSAKGAGKFEKILPLHKFHVKQLIQTPFKAKDNS